MTWHGIGLKARGKAKTQKRKAKAIALVHTKGRSKLRVFSYKYAPLFFITSPLPSPCNFPVHQT